MGGVAISIQANSSSSKAVGSPSHSSEWRCSLRRLRLADCDYLAESALGSLIGHAEMETLDLSRTTHVLTGASVAALLHLGGEATVCQHGAQAIRPPQKSPHAWHMKPVGELRRWHGLHRTLLSTACGNIVAMPLTCKPPSMGVLIRLCRTWWRAYTSVQC